MASRDSRRSSNKRSGSGFVILLIAAAAGIWLFEQYQQRGGKPENQPTQPPASSPTQPGEASPTRSGGYEIHQNCSLVSARNNDGDSFMVRLPDGRQRELRLYFVDTPESAFKRYAGGDTNHKRIRQQAAELGGITPEQAVDIGKKGKSFTLGLLESRPFTIFTVWDSPFHDERYHAFIEITHSGSKRWLHEVLIERGLARIKTKPANLPDGTPSADQRKHLKSLETKAKHTRTGVWGL